ncbi:hypothetical protein [Salinibacterium sp. GXW1014]|uniref:hypothetical protein n=1 Tax=Salinibacterium sp. GXW1014 TaxID=3377838 RepID=UPI00383B4DD2
MSAKDNVVVVGGEPRIDFLPPEIREKKKARRTIRSLVLLVVMVIVVCVVAYVGATSLAVTSQVRLAAEQERTQELLRNQAAFSDVRQLKQTVEAAQDARIVASGNEIMWKPIVDAALAVLPAGEELMELNIDSYVVGEAPAAPEDLQITSQATIEFKLRFDRVRTIADWADRLAELPQVAGVSFGGAVLDETTGVYEAVVIVHVDESQFERRYFLTPRPETEEGTQ